jgi:hypothetical protein
VLTLVTFVKWTIRILASTPGSLSTAINDQTDNAAIDRQFPGLALARAYIHARRRLQIDLGHLASW